MALAWLEPKRARRGWAALLGATLLIVVLAVVDADEKERSGGYAPLEDADWYFAADDFPGFWRAFEASGTFFRISSDAPEVYPRLQTWFRGTTSVRWTPSRWKLWFGNPIVLSGKDNEMVGWVRPGLTFRAILVIGCWTGRVEQDGDQLRFDDAYARWDGVDLVFGSSREIVGYFLSTLQPAVLTVAPVSEASIRVGKENPIGLSVRFNNELATTLHIPTDPARRIRRAEYFSIDWPSKPIVSVSLRDFSFSKSIEPDAWPEFPGSEDLSRLWADFEALLPEGWRAGADTTQFALFGVDTSENVLVPDAAVYSRSETPLASLLPPPNAIPYEWSGSAGWMTPWLGEGAHLFVVADERSRVFTNHESTMAALMGRRRAGRIASNDARIEIDTGRLAGVLRDLARRAAKNELWPERNADDVERDVIPWLNAIGELGILQLEGQYDGEALVLRGGTQAPPPEHAS